ncbi:hypothetical protein NLI96_g7371 [Meripilus lineatus]|uniref:DUF6535 domain-containing protein n=1 Tax=Meripilus lineatus TaxID=2056292 RepID=A0AAD5YD11_9APHY|nr:hypothetical protein NLI96_g7371 [Physisporinus lineatus]
MSVPGITAYERLGYKLSMQQRAGSPVVEAILPRAPQDGGLPSQVIDQRCQTDSTQTQMKNGQEEEDDPLVKPYFESRCEIFDRFLPKIEMSTTKRWSQLSNVLQKFDDTQSKTNNENIDTLLVFAGLFSAILTAFIVEAIKLLHQDPTDISVHILMQISQQLSSFSTNPGFINSTYVPIAPSTTFTPTINSLWVNTLWFAALIFSLITGSLGMLVKQWLREYQSNPRVSPEEHRRVRLFRIRGLRRYGVLEIASFLPLLLQIALVLFFIGLALFVFEVHHSIGYFVLTIVMIWFLFLGVTTILPLFSPSCPYKTPFLKAAILRFRLLLNSLYPKVLSMSLKKKMDATQADVSERKLFVEEADIAQNMELDYEVQLDARDTFRDIKVWEMIVYCVDHDSLLDSLARLVRIVEKRSGSTVAPSSNLRGWFTREEWDVLMQSMIICLRKIFLDVPPDGLRDIDLQALITLEHCTLASQASSKPNLVEARFSTSNIAHKDY